MSSTVPMSKAQKLRVSALVERIERQQRYDRVHRVKHGVPTPEQARALARVMGPGLRKISR
ncbi:hypothetical protein HH308_06500 [Gordonia sp. TBRC 11910]|uniref:Uncharacterized protein n=1 Tax=Gordonia asplenii TaxID=2725283 RepID=A0A848KRH9_9ACTN|nr:hypothetical protein [Gordonia asplenii]NMO00862.1 hypothetical protein [Gordonia asplenii]